MGCGVRRDVVEDPHREGYPPAARQEVMGETEELLHICDMDAEMPSGGARGPDISPLGPTADGPGGDAKPLGHRSDGEHVPHVDLARPECAQATV
jgi:hypothetical protein